MRCRSSSQNGLPEALRAPPGAAGTPKTAPRGAKSAPRRLKKAPRAASDPHKVVPNRQKQSLQPAIPATNNPRNEQTATPTTKQQQATINNNRPLFCFFNDFRYAFADFFVLVLSSLLAPSPGSLSQVRVPPSFRVTTLYTMLSPKPVPPAPL